MIFEEKNEALGKLCEIVKMLLFNLAQGFLKCLTVIFNQNSKQKMFVTNIG